MKKIQSINPYTKELNAEFELLNESEILEKIEIANNSFKNWKNTSNSQKKKLFTKLSEILLENKEELAKLNVIEMGMTYKNALADVSKSASGIMWFVNNFEEILQDKQFSEGGITGIITYEPLGVLYSVAPWNFPYNQVFRNAIPNILAGNVVLNKHASNVPFVAKKIEELFLQSGFPDGVFTNLFISPSDSDLIINHPFVRGANITGGETAGRHIGALAGKKLIPSILELGGNDPFLVLDNNDLDRIVNDAVSARLGNCGQKCNSAKRFIVLEKYYEDFCDRFTKKMQEVKVGDPMDDKNTMGPLAKTSLIDEIEKQISDSIEKGAILLTGGKATHREKNLFPPTVLKDVVPGMKVFDEEVFGPVAPIIKAIDIDEAIKFANNSKFGLGCSLYGDDIEQLREVSKKIEAGNVYINKIVTSYPFLPYGGIKDSGYGKELAENGLKNFVNEKVIVE
ncbi:MAG: aldehyde dehydrogenase family protein [Candidatus Gracilibacteria bacterium]|nr:aldehyde dehydrogenase family protein [Candidatus Gracilibacteria bacterium]